MVLAHMRYPEQWNPYKENVASCSPGSEGRMFNVTVFNVNTVSVWDIKLFCTWTVGIGCTII